MKFKKIAAILAATAVMCFGGFSIIHAENTEEIEATEASEVLKSQDGMWSYSILTDEETKKEYVSIVKSYSSEPEVTIPTEIDGITVKNINEYAFMINDNLNTTMTKLTISSSIETFNDFAFFGCTALQEFSVENGNEVYSAKDGVLFGDDEMLLVGYPSAKSDKEYTVPDGVVALNPGAFSLCSGIEKINFPDSLERIGEFCFSECTSLDNIEIPEKVSELAYYTFGTCTSLSSIKLPENMHTIGGGAFAYCSSLSSIEFPKYIKEIGQAAFAATAFTEIELPSTINNIGYYAFGFTTDSQGMFVAMDDFTIKGVEGSMAQSYCGEAENAHITFEAIDSGAETETAAEGETDTNAAADNSENATSDNSKNSDNENKSEKNEGLKPGIIVAISVCAAAVVIIIIIFIIKHKKSTKENENNNQTDNDIE